MHILTKASGNSMCIIQMWQCVLELYKWELYFLLFVIWIRTCCFALSSFSDWLLLFKNSAQHYQLFSLWFLTIFSCGALNPWCVPPPWYTRSTLCWDFSYLGLCPIGLNGQSPGCPPHRAVNSLRAGLFPGLPDTACCILSPQYILIKWASLEIKGGIEECIRTMVNWSTYNDGLLVRVANSLLCMFDASSCGTLQYGYLI